jgi:HSP20 family protein
MRSSMQIYTGRNIPQFMPDFSLFTEPYDLVSEMQGGIELAETSEHFVATLDLPGVKAEDLKLEVTEKVLTVSGHRKREIPDNAGRSTANRTLSSFSRNFSIPTAIDTGKIEAELSDGVLKVLMPKAEQAKPRTISINSENGILAKLLGKKSGQ